ncbi:MAG: peptidyl-prolyl cis-trans isomerase [Nitrospiria bacterium]
MRVREGAKYLGSIALLLLASGCWQEKESMLIATLAQVNHEEITAQDLLATLPEEGGESGQEPSEMSAEEGIRLRRNLLAQLIERKMLLQEARRLQVRISDEELRRRFEEIIDGKKEEIFLQFLSDEGLTRDGWENAIQENLLIERMLDQVIRDQAYITQEETRRYYKDHPEKWRIGVEVRLRQIVVETQAEAEDLRLSILGGEDFKQAVRKFSKVSQDGGRGDLGYLGRAEIPMEFDGIFDSEIGAVSPVIKTPFGYHLVKVEDRRPPRTLHFDTVKERIQRVLLEEKKERIFLEWIEKLRRRTEVIINEELLLKFS